LEPPGEAGERFRQRVEVKKELAEALTEVDQVKEELQKLKEEVTEKSCEGEASSSQPLKKVKLEPKD
jgi:DNA-binding protein YbaB